jgi:hypothetical protein
MKTNTEETDMEDCTVCGADFDLIGEGGVRGDFGILPIAFCPTCLSCMLDMAEQMGVGQDIDNGWESVKGGDKKK